MALGKGDLLVARVGSKTVAMSLDEPNSHEAFASRQQQQVAT